MLFWTTQLLNVTSSWYIRFQTKTATVTARTYIHLGDHCLLTGVLFMLFHLFFSHPGETRISDIENQETSENRSQSDTHPDMSVSLRHYSYEFSSDKTSNIHDNIYSFVLLGMETAWRLMWSILFSNFVPSRRRSFRGRSAFGFWFRLILTHLVPGTIRERFWTCEIRRSRTNLQRKVQLTS